jgi:hypothetical protein
MIHYIEFASGKCLQKSFFFYFLFLISLENLNEYNRREKERENINNNNNNNNKTNLFVVVYELREIKFQIQIINL